MSLATYSALIASIASWLARTDLTATIPDFVTLAEARINRELRCREMIEQTTGSLSTQTLAIPSDFVEAMRLTLDTESDMPLEYRPVEDSELRVAGTTSGEPKWFSVVGSNFRFYPAPDGEYTYTLDYYASLPPLGGSNPTNWLLTKVPDLYLAAALKEGFDFLLEPDSSAVWDGRYREVLRSLHGAEARAKRTSAGRRMRVVA